MTAVSEQISTAMTMREAEVLASLAHHRNVLEFGSLLGYSTIVMAKSPAKTVYAVDPHEGYPEHDPRPTLSSFITNLERAGVKDRVVPIVSRGQNINAILRPGAFDLVFIDFTEDAAELLEIAHSLAPDVIAVHDYGIEKWPGATRAVNSFSERIGRKFRLVDTLAVFE